MAVDCVEEPRSRNAKGYGRIFRRVGGKSRTFMAHRVAYEAERGPIPEGLTIDHLCANTRCENPSHMEVVTASENLRRMHAQRNHRRAWTHCPQGHPYNEANVYMYRGKRNCRLCRTEAAKRYLARKVG